MSNSMDYYETLGVPRTADADEIRKAYRKLARKHHPDLNPGDKAAEDRFKKVQEAYDVLSDDKKKQMYDQVGFYSANGMPGGGAGPGGGNGPNMGFGGFDFSDMFARGAHASSGGSAGGAAGAGAGNFQDIFNHWFGRSHDAQQPQQAPQKGTDIEYGLNIDFWQAIRGTQARLSIAHQEACATCNGTGVRRGADVVCPECSGSGSVTQTAGAMRFSLTCPRCEGSGHLRNRCATCHGDGRVSAMESVE